MTDIQAKIDFLLDDRRWSSYQEGGSLVNWLLQTWGLLVHAGKTIVSKRIMDDAASLTYNTLMAIVPIFAVVFEIARGLHVAEYLEEWVVKSLESQPEVANYIVNFANSYISHYNRGLFIFIAIVATLYTALTLVMKVEAAFNKIWRVSRTDDRSFVQTFLVAISLFGFILMFFLLAAGINVAFAVLSDFVRDVWFVVPVVKRLLGLVPVFLLWLMFVLLFVFMPHTHVRFRDVWAPAMLAAIAMQAVQYVYIHGQILLSSYSAIYGSFAALPLFLLWVNFSWSISLVCATLCYEKRIKKS